MHSLSEQQPRRMFGIYNSLGFQCIPLFRSIQAAAITRYRPQRSIHRSIAAARRNNSNASGPNPPGEISSSNSNSGNRGSNSGSNSSNSQPGRAQRTLRGTHSLRPRGGLVPPRQLQQRSPSRDTQKCSPSIEQQVQEMQQLMDEQVVPTIAELQRTLHAMQQQRPALQETSLTSQSLETNPATDSGTGNYDSCSNDRIDANSDSSSSSNGRVSRPATSSSSSVSRSSSRGYGTSTAAPPRPPRPPPRPRPALTSGPGAPYSGNRAKTHNASSASGSSSSSSGSSSSSRSSSSSWPGTLRRKGYMYFDFEKEHLKIIATQGLVGLPNWNAWGDQQLLTAWQVAAALLPAAVDRLAAVSLAGPTKVVCFDFETTHPFGVPDVLELAGVTEDGQAFQSLVRPISQIPNPHISGFTWEHVQAAPALPSVLLAFVEWLTQQCSSSPGGSSTLLLLGHNIKSFDINKVLRPWLVDGLHVKQIDQLLGPKTSSISRPPNSHGSSWIILDTLDVAKKVQRMLNGNPNALEPAKRADYPWGKTNGSNKLQELRKAFGITQDEEHRALEDCTTNLEVFRRLVNLQPHWDPSVTDVTALAERWLTEQANYGFKGTARQQQQQQAMLQQKSVLQQQQQQQVQIATMDLPAWVSQELPWDTLQTVVVEQQQQQQQQQRLPRGVSSTAAPSSSSYGRYSSSNSSSGGVPLPAIDPNVIEARISQALERLTEQDLDFSRRELSKAWSPLGDDPAGFKKVFTAIQHEKLAAAGFNNLLKVLTYAPKVLQYDNCIRLTSSSSNKDNSSSSSSSQASPQGEALSSSNSSSSMDEGDAGVPDVQLVDMAVSLVATTRMIPTTKGCFWNAVYQVPTDTPTTQPVYLRVANFHPGKSQWAIGIGNKAKSMAEAYKTALIRGKVKPAGATIGGYWCEWESVGAMTVEYPTTTTGSSSSGSDDGTAAAAAAARNPLVPVYRAAKGLQSGDFVSTARGKGVIDKALDAVRQSSNQGELLPDEMLQQYQLPPFITALQDLHQPTDMEAHRAARRRLAFQELLLVQMAQLLERYWLQRGMQQPRSAAAAGRGAAAVAAAAPAAIDDEVSSLLATSSSTKSDADAPDQPGKRKKAGRRKKVEQQEQQDSQSPEQQQQWALRQAAATAYQITDTSIISTAKQLLPYQLTADQDKVLSEVLDDLAKPQAMLRLLQGDVGCGKTVVAVLACLAAHKAGCQALILAPTELLASQHFDTLSLITEQLPLIDRPRVHLLTGSSLIKQKKQAHSAIKQGSVDILVSTQAALWVPEWGSLGLVVVDEQHKFGVKQREMLTKRVQAPPHMLLMTATPIPRTLALVQYGGLTLSTITQMPPGRRPVATKVVVDSDAAREEVYDAIRSELDAGGRVYIVCALVNECDALDGVKAAEQEYQRLSQHGVFGTHACGLLHGKMDKDQKAEALRKFNSGETPVLISSTVVEVGIDEPEASIMLVENAARFGLAQLHQLRGRVGRGTRASRCFLIAPPADADAAAAAAERLRVLEESHNGLVIAEADLKFRGPGDVWGVKQSGKPSALSHLAWDELQSDPQLLDHARAAAAQLLPRLGSEPKLKTALLAYNLMVLQEDGKPPLLRDGVSGV